MTWFGTRCPLKIGRVTLAYVLASWLLWGCTTPTPMATAIAPGPTAATYSGRLGLRVETAEPQNFSADFALQGNARAGSLELTGPFGGTLAEVQWGPQGASLVQQGQTRHFADLPSLLTELTGVDVPMAAVFEWLQGKGSASLDNAGWLLIPDPAYPRKLKAQRRNPLPAVHLVLVVDETP